MAWAAALLAGVGLGMLGNEVFAWLPWLACKTVRLAAKIDADCPEEVDDLYADMMIGVMGRPAPLAALCTAGGLLIKVAVARRVRDAIVAGYCGVLVRVHLVRLALSWPGVLPFDARQAAARDRSDSVAEFPDEPDVDIGPGLRATNREASGTVPELMRALPRKEQDILVLRIMVGLSADETADAVGSTPGAVRVAQQRALARLRKLMKEEFPWA